MMLVTEYPGSRYPDLLTCDSRDAKDRRKKRHPKLIFEVFSESTSGVDAADKLDEYQTIEALQEYALVDSRKSSVRIYRRNGEKLETEAAVISGKSNFNRSTSRYRSRITRMSPARRPNARRSK